MPSVQNQGQVNQATGEVKKASPFARICARTDKFIDAGLDCSNPIVIDYKRVKSCHKTGDLDTDFILEEKTVESGKRNLTDIANSYKDDTDIYQIMKKVSLTGDLSVMNKNMANSLNKDDEVVDVSTMPKDLISANQMVRQAQRNYENLPDALKNGASQEEIATQFTQKEIDAYIATLEAASKKKVDNPQPQPNDAGGDK